MLKQQVRLQCGDAKTPGETAEGVVCGSGKESGEVVGCG